MDSTNNYVYGNSIGTLLDHRTNRMKVPPGSTLYLVPRGSSQYLIASRTYLKGIIRSMSNRYPTPGQAKALRKLLGNTVALTADRQGRVKIPKRVGQVDYRIIGTITTSTIAK